jgi:hypothetical protein
LNYFAHALPFLDNPYFVAGTGVPDWLSVADRETRVRMKQAVPLATDPDPIMAAVAGGVAQHIRDDLRFHATRAFAETSLELAAAARGVLGPDSGFRSSFIGHLLVELLLDASLIAEQPEKLDAYYRRLDAVDSQIVQVAVNRIAAKPTDRLAGFIVLFRRERILWDYSDDARLMWRMNQVMGRVGFEPLPERFGEVLPPAREMVARRRAGLLEGIPAGQNF